MLIIARAVHLGSLSFIVGGFAFAALVGIPALLEAGESARQQLEALDRWLLRAAGWSVAVAFGSGFWWLLIVAAQMSGMSIDQTLSSDTIGTVLGHTNFGHVWLLRAAILALLSGYVGFLIRRPQQRAHGLLLHSVGMLLGGTLLATVAAAGHAAASDRSGRWLHLSSDAIHLLAAGVWVGSLPPLAWLVKQALRTPSAWLAGAVAETAARYSVLGMACVGSLVTTGAVNTWFLAGSASALLGTPYGRLLLLKLVLFAAMVAVASINRQKLRPRLRNAARACSEQTALGALIWLARNIMVELCLGISVLFLAGALGATAPAVHMHH